MGVEGGGGIQEKKVERGWANECECEFDIQ